MTDNKTTVAAINRFGSKSPSIQTYASALFHQTWSLEQHLTALHIPGPENVVADLLSRDRIIDSEWELTPESFRSLEDRLGSLEIDLFSSPINHKLEKFVTTFAHPRAYAVNAFTLNWNQFQNIYLFPPPKAIPRVISKLRRYRGSGVIIVPNRPTAAWFPFLAKKANPLNLLLKVTQSVDGSTIDHSQTASAPWIGFRF